MKKSRMIGQVVMLFCFCVLVSVVTAATSPLEGLHKVSSNNCGNITTQPNLVIGGMWTYPVDAVPESSVGKNDPARTAAFGETVVFSFDGLKSNETYVLAFRFLSDDALRVQSVGVDDVVLEEKLSLPKSKIIERTYTLDKSVYADGKIQVNVTKLAGPNAVVSTLDVYSSDSTPLKKTGFDASAILERMGLSRSSVNKKGKPIDMLLLNGTWKFNEAPPADFWKQSKVSAAWSDIEVPGEWVMQGFEVVPETAAGYVRSFEIPKRWGDKQVKLRFDAVFSMADVYVNGKRVGSHEGGFTPFEIDITDAVQFGAENTLAVAVTSESLSDILGSASQYAVHPLGGIVRKVTLFAVPPVNVQSYHVTTEFDKEFDDATMQIAMKINNQTDSVLEGAKLKFSLMKWPSRKTVKLKRKHFELPNLDAGQWLNENIEIEVDSPDKWDNEHPNLYVLQCKITKGFKTFQTIERRFGFRQVEVRGNELFVNNYPVKLRASNRHEVHPKRGRSLTMDQWRADVELFREANCNLIRTSHYPPAEEFIDLCDELGVFVEEEAAICWVGHGANGIWKKWNPQSEHYREIIVRSALEMIERDRSHPSIIFWSLANESAWGPNFQHSYDTAREYDPSRPFTFHDQSAGQWNNNGSSTDIANHHYPGPNGAKNFSDSKRPMWFGEYCHLDAYNRYELWTDPGLRDAWGRGFKTMWDKMYATKAILGGALWSGVDDTFHLPSGHTVGYGTWGPIDGWRRRKPEHWHAKKVYSPVRISVDTIDVPGAGTTLMIPLENRHNFTNISELDIRWKIGDNEGKAIADIAPRTKGKMAIRTDVSDLEGKTIHLQFHSPLGFLVDEYCLPIGKPELIQNRIVKTGTDKVDVQSNDNQIIVTAGDFVVTFDKHAGQISGMTKTGSTVLGAGPELMILALNSAGDTQMTKQMKPVSSDTSIRSGRKVESVSLTQKDTAAVISVTDVYDIAKGGYALTVDASGGVVINYEYELTAAVNPRQYGMVMTFPGSFNQLHWKRKGMWSVYPADHIARLEGVANAFVGAEFSGTAGPVAEPDYPWRHDTNELGTNDFRSTKENIIHAYLKNTKTEGPIVVSDGSQHVRCWVDGDTTRMLIAEYNNPGSERFFRGHAALEDKPLKPGDKIRGSIRFIGLGH